MKSIKRITSTCIFIAFLLLMFIGISLAASDYPVKPITFIVPYEPGGGSDIKVRIIANVVRKYSPQPFIVINSPGASGTKAVYELVKSKPDGYTIAFVSDSEGCSALHLIPANYTIDDYTIICCADYISPVITTKGPWNNLKEFIDYARKNPSEIKAGVPGLGTTVRLTGERFAKKAGLQVRIVPFQGSGPLIPAILGGHVEIGYNWPDGVMGLYKSGELKILCYFGDKRSKTLPNVPTAKEQGIDVSGGSKHFIIVPNGVPVPVRERLNGLLKKTIEDPEFEKKLSELANEANYEDAEASKRWLKEWYKTSGELYDMLGMRKR